MKETFSYKRLWVLILFPIALIAGAYARSDPEFCEEFARNVYPVISGIVNRIFSMIPVSAAEIILIGFAVLVAVYVVGTVLRLIFGGKRLKTLFAFLINMACILSAIYFIFTVTCGFNYYRFTFAETAGYKIEKSTVSELETLFEELVFRLNAAAEEIENVENTEKTFGELAAKAEEAVAALAVDFPTLSGDYGAPKPVSFFGYMSYSQITGFFFPFTYEANVNSQIPEISLPATMCHELVHLRGYMREDEANFIAYLACVNSGDPEFVYSGLLLAYSYTASALYSASPERYAETASALNEKVKNDIAAKNEYWNGYEGLFADFSDAVNDTYLKINDQTDGVKSYGRMVDLLLAEYKATH